MGGRQGRLNVGETRAAVTSAGSQPVPDHVRDLYTDQWSRVLTPLQDALEARSQEVLAQRSRRMNDKREREEQRLRGTLTDLQSSIEHRLIELEQSEHVEQLSLFDTGERLQFDVDKQALRDRIERIGDDIEKEVEILRRRYKVRTSTGSRSGSSSSSPRMSASAHATPRRRAA